MCLSPQFCSLLFCFVLFSGFKRQPNDNIKNNFQMNATIAAGQLLGLRIATQFYTFNALSSVLKYLTLHHGCYANVRAYNRILLRAISTHSTTVQFIFVYVIKGNPYLYQKYHFSINVDTRIDMKKICSSFNISNECFFFARD